MSRKELERMTMLGEAQCGRLSWHADKVGSIDEWGNREEEDTLMCGSPIEPIIFNYLYHPTKQKTRMNSFLSTKCRMKLETKSSFPSMSPNQTLVC